MLTFVTVCNYVTMIVVMLKTQNPRTDKEYILNTERNKLQRKKPKNINNIATNKI